MFTIAIANLRKGKAFAYSIAFGAAAVLCLTSVLIAFISRHYGVPALVIAVWRDAFTSAALAIAFALFAPRLLAPRREDIGILVLNGLVLALFNIALTISVVMNGAAASTFLVYSSGGFTVILGRVFLREEVNLAKALAVAASLAGAALVSGVFEGDTVAPKALGIVAGLASGLGYAAYSLVGKAVTRRGVSSWTGVCLSFGLAALFLLLSRPLLSGILPAGSIGHGELFLPGKDIGAWLLLILLAAGPTAMGFGLYNASLVRLPAGTANLVVSTEVLFTAIVAWIFLGERMGPSALAGGALILAAVFILGLGERGGSGLEGGRKVIRRAYDSLFAKKGATRSEPYTAQRDVAGPGFRLPGQDFSPILRDGDLS